MIYTDKTAKALEIALIAHEGQYDKQGFPYIAHPLHVAEQMDDERACIVALLHDVIEDSTEFTFEELSEAFSINIVEALDAITRRKEEKYFDYIERLKTNPIAKKVKIVDLQHNLDESRGNIQGSLKERYETALQMLTFDPCNLQTAVDMYIEGANHKIGPDEKAIERATGISDAIYDDIAKCYAELLVSAVTLEYVLAQREQYFRSRISGYLQKQYTWDEYLEPDAEGRYIVESTLSFYIEGHVKWHIGENTLGETLKNARFIGSSDDAQAEMFSDCVARYIQRIENCKKGSKLPEGVIEYIAYKGNPLKANELPYAVI